MSASPAPSPAPTPAPRSTAGVASPCIGICRMQPATGLCEGCHRTLDEIAAWSQLGDPQRLAVWRLVRQRRAASAGS